MKCRFFPTLLAAIIPMAGTAQIEMNDSVSIRQNVTGGLHPETIGTAESESTLTKPAVYPWTLNPTIYPLMTYARATDLNISGLHCTPGQASLFHWNSGGISASGSSGSLPGLMQIDRGALGIYQSAGSFTFQAGVMANKYGYFKGLHTQYGVNGSITYRFSPRLSATIFGDYYFGRPPRMADGAPMPPSMVGYYGRCSYGGYVDYQVNEYWGVQAGAQSVQQVGTDKYEAEPIITPYYKINKKVAIGLPVGQILYHLLK